MADEKVVRVDVLTGASLVANYLEAPHVDLQSILGTKSPLYVEAGPLHSILADHEAPEVSLGWDGDKTLTVQKTDGGVMATFELKF